MNKNSKEIQMKVAFRDFCRGIMAVTDSSRDFTTEDVVRTLAEILADGYDESLFEMASENFCELMSGSGANYENYAEGLRPIAEAFSSIMVEHLLNNSEAIAKEIENYLGVYE